MELSALHTRFQEVFESEAGRAFFAPGRINLIGEHTDYNGGRVFPCAITQGTYGIARRRQDSLVRCYSLNFEEAGLISFDLSQELVNRQKIAGLTLSKAKSNSCAKLATPSTKASTSWFTAISLTGQVSQVLLPWNYW